MTESNGNPNHRHRAGRCLTSRQVGVIRQLRGSGMSIRKISKITTFAKATVEKYLKQGHEFADARETVE